MEKELCHGLMEPNMRENGKWDMLVEMERFIMLMVIFMMDNGTIINVMVMVFILIKKGLNMKDIGKMILNQDKELKFGLKEASMLVNMKMERNKDMVHILGLMDLFTKETGLTIVLMVLANINGKMEDNITVTGTITICMEWASTFIQTE